MKLENPCYGASLEVGIEESEWYGERLPFKPSVKQLLSYCLSQYQVPYKNYKTKRATFDDEALEKLSGKYPEDPLYRKVQDYREIDRAKGTYVDGKGFSVGKDGRVHPVFTHTPSTLRFAAQNPPIQQIPRSDDDENPLYKRIRGLFVAAQGHCLLARDYSGIEARLVAYLAGDKDLLRLTGIGNGPHSFVVSQLLKKPIDLSWDDEKIGFHAAEIKKNHSVLYSSCKTALYTSLYLGGPGELVRSYPKLFHSVGYAKEIQDVIWRTFPSIPKWQENTWKEAHKLGFLQCPDGFRHYYWAAGKSSFSKKTNSWETSIGPEGKSAISMRPQHLGALYMSLALSGAWNSPLRESMRLTIHDELMLEISLQKVQESSIMLKEIMERPNKFLPLPKDWGLGDHLVIFTEAKAGPSWASMKKLKD